MTDRGARFARTGVGSAVRPGDGGVAGVCRSAARIILVVIGFAALSFTSGSALASSTKVDFGDISHKGLKNLGPASTGLKLSLQLGMIANQQGIANAVKAASNPSSSTYGQYLTLSALQKKYGASSSRRNAVVGAFKPYGVKATVDVTHLRVSATIVARDSAGAMHTTQSVLTLRAAKSKHH